MLIAEVPEFTRPTNSSITFGGSPAAGTTVGTEMTRAIAINYTQNELSAIVMSQKKRARPEKYDKLFADSRAASLNHA
jgi:hypothetical protein